MKKDRPLSEKAIKAAADRAEGKELEQVLALGDDGKPISTLKSGRPSSYKKEYAKQAQKLCALGATDMEVADFFQVSVATISNWKNGHKDFLEALKSGKAKSDERVERSLYHRAIGYSFDSEEIFNNKGEIIRVPVRKHLPPDTTAMIFWLKNRRKEQWRDRYEHTGEDGDPIKHAVTMEYVKPK
jgi:hypothetical protein